jgi:hypothetical protein
MCAVLLVTAYIVAAIAAYLRVGTVSGVGSFTRPVFFALLGWAAYNGKSWARWILSLITAIGAVLWLRMGISLWAEYTGTSVIMFVGGGGLIAMCLVLMLSDDVSEFFRQRAG